VTGFRAFGRMARNPSSDVVAALARDPEMRAAGVRTSLLPVHRHAAPRHLARLLALHQPSAVLLLGVAAGRSAIHVERRAVNLYRGPRARHAGLPICAGAPSVLRSTLSVRLLRRAMASTRAPVAYSDSAGTYACNLVLYSTLLWGRRGLPDGRPLRTLAAFVHLPATPESLGALHRSTPTLPLPTLVGAVRAALFTLVS